MTLDEAGQPAGGKAPQSVGMGTRPAGGEGGERPEAGDTPQPVDRAAAFAASRPGIPRKAVIWTLAVALVLLLGGTLGERLLSNAGLNPTAAPTSGGAGSPSPQAEVPTGSTVASSLAASMGIVPMNAPAPPISLVDQRGRPLTLAELRGRVVVVTFFAATCSDICPVLAQEIRGAEADLGRLAAKVVFVTVNADPLAIGPQPATPPLGSTGLTQLANWYFLSGGIEALQAVWQHYGVTIDVMPTTGAIAHNDVMYFVDPAGKLRFRATPYADESPAGVFTLQPSLVRRWATGIATYAAKLVNGT